ncbi:MAG: alpha-L-fucosidase [Acidobacteria bacterium]|nr:alpha-L-fucosidase [Acidobacteriota bacterium]
MNRRQFSASLASSLLPYPALAAPPAPFGPVPTARQLLWHELEVYAFLHFTINTFTDKEWGYGDESPSLFAPSAFDAGAILEALSAGGMKAVILTCKHHDGFCLWPTKTTAHSVRNSKWRDGRGDVVKEIAEAARRRGMKFGVYLSPWDRNNAHYATAEYIRIYREQLRELLTQYGPIYEVWHDGANGGDGFYGGKREKRTIDKRVYYDWPNTWEMVRKLQPNAVIFSDVGPDIRWVGNEKGFANETCWATFTPSARDGGPAMPGLVKEKESPTGHRNGKQWLPAECDVSIRPGWFWHENQNPRVKQPRDLMDLYFKSVGRGASFLLNVPPDRRGLLHESDVASLKGFGTAVREMFAKNLATGATVKASNTRAGAFRAANLVDGRRDTCWASQDTVMQPSVELQLRRDEALRVIRLREAIPFGQRIDSIAVDAWQDGDWKEVAAATSIGNCRLLQLPEPVRTARVRVRVTQAAASPALCEIGLF